MIKKNIHRGKKGDELIEKTHNDHKDKFKEDKGVELKEKTYNDHKDKFTEERDSVL